MRRDLTTNACRRRLLAVAVIAAALGLAACGSNGHATTAPPARSTAAPTSTTSAAPTPALTSTTATTPAPTSSPTAASTMSAASARRLKRFLFAAKDDKSFPPPQPGAVVLTSLEKWVSFSELLPVDERLLRSEGFVAAAQENVGQYGSSFVEVFTSAAGAREEAANDATQSTQSGAGVTFFSDPALPNAHGVIVSQTGGDGTNLYWTEGRCTLWLGTGASTTVVPEIKAGAKAIDRRTGGKCP